MRFTFQILSLILFLLPAVIVSHEGQVEESPKEAPSVQRPMLLGLTRQEARQRWGEPDKCYYTFDAEQCTSPDYDWSTVEILGTLEDVYHRKTAANTYEILVRYNVYQRPSLGKAEIRVIDVEFKPAKPTTVQPMLRDLPEALELCRSGCEMQGFKGGGLPSVLVYPQNPTLRQRALADRVMYGWKLAPPEKRGRRMEYIPTVELDLQEKPGDQYRKVHEIPWVDRSVKWVIFSMAPPRSFLDQDRIGRNLLPQSRLVLGLFTP